LLFKNLFVLQLVQRSPRVNRPPDLRDNPLPSRPEDPPVNLPRIPVVLARSLPRNRPLSRFLVLLSIRLVSPLGIPLDNPVLDQLLLPRRSIASRRHLNRAHNRLRDLPGCHPRDLQAPRRLQK
jgi:hypothetical protein